MIMSPGLRKVALAVHIALSVGWLGAVFAYVALDVTAATSQDAQALRAAYLAMGVTASYVIVPLAFASLLTGLVMSLGTRWGLFRHYWVLISLILTILATVVLVSETRTISYFAGIAADPATSGDDLRALGNTLGHSVGGAVVLLVILVLNVYKPRGLTKYGWRKNKRSARRRSRDMRSCPMHPEVRQEGPGRCPKCGMPLEAEARPSHEHGEPQDSYMPLAVLFVLLLAATGVVAWRDAAEGRFSVPMTVSAFMAGFFLVFAGFKLMDLRGFAAGYATYDLLAQRFPAYGYAYPFIELGFGLAMLAGIAAPGLLWAEVAVMGFSGLGVALKLAKGERFRCACLGTFLKLPLTYVTLVEDFGMAALALLLLFLG